MKWAAVTGLFILIVIAAVALVVIPAPKTANAPAPASLTDLIIVTAPLPNSNVESPLSVSGKARGNWYFEASAPYALQDASGNVISQGHIDAQGDWMTTDFVPFSATITFPTQPTGSTGALILKNDNPSGDQDNQKELFIPVVFK
jgi:hypothetical protein